VHGIWFLYNTNTTTPHMRVGPSMWDPPSCERLLYSCCIGVVNLTFSISAQLQGILRRDLILVQHQYNNCTTTLHMRVDPIMWDPSSCEGLLYSCCIGVVNLTFSYWEDPHVHNSKTHSVNRIRLCPFCFIIIILLKIRLRIRYLSKPTNG
jgi:hypothetical protein